MVKPVIFRRPARIRSREGGFIARQYPQLVHIGVKPEVNEIAYRAFKKYETYE